MTVSTINVSNSIALNAALEGATGGETIILAQGNYGALTLSRLDFAAAVKVVGGTFDSVTMSNVHGLTLDGSTVLFTPTASSTSNSQAIRIWGSSDIVITNAVVTGGQSVNGVEPSATTLDSTGNVLGQPVGKAINIDSSSVVADGSTPFTDCPPVTTALVMTMSLLPQMRIA